MKFKIKRTTLTFKESFLETVFDTREEAAAACRILNSARNDFYSVVEA